MTPAPSDSTPTALGEQAVAPVPPENDTPETKNRHLLRKDQSSTDAAAAAAEKKASIAKARQQPETMIAVSVSASCSLARIVLVNDYEGQGVPVLLLSSRQVCQFVFPYSSLFFILD